MEKVASLQKRGTASYFSRVPTQFCVIYGMAREEGMRPVPALKFASKIVKDGIVMHFRIPEGTERSSIERDTAGNHYTRDARGTVRRMA